MKNKKNNKRLQNLPCVFKVGTFLLYIRKQVSYFIRPVLIRRAITLAVVFHCAVLLQDAFVFF